MCTHACVLPRGHRRRHVVFFGLKLVSVAWCSVRLGHVVRQTLELLRPRGAGEHPIGCQVKIRVLRSKNILQFRQSQHVCVFFASAASFCSAITTRFARSVSTDIFAHAVFNTQQYFVSRPGGRVPHCVWHQVGQTRRPNQKWSECRWPS